MNDFSQVRNPPLSYFVDAIREGPPYALSRYGDGECRVILGEPAVGSRVNSNGCTMTPALQADMQAALIEQGSYDYAISRIARRKYGDRLAQWLQREGVTLTHWILADRILEASLRGNLHPLIEAIRAHTVVYVGPEWCRRLSPSFFEIAAFVEPSLKDAHAQIDRLRRETWQAVERVDATFIGVSCGLAARVLVHQLYEMLGDRVVVVDFGSMWDGYFGVKSRSYIRNNIYDWDMLRQLNTGQVAYA